MSKKDRKIDIENFNNLLEKSSNGKHYLKIPVDNYMEIGFFQRALLNSICALSQEMDDTESNKSALDVKLLAQVLIDTFPNHEYEFIDMHNGTHF